MKPATKAGAVAPAMAARPGSAPRLHVVKGGRATEQDARTRADRVRNARARISAGYYDRPDIRERVLAAVLDEIEER